MQHLIVIMNEIGYNERYKRVTGGICMGSYLNPGNFSFRGSLRSKIYGTLAKDAFAAGSTANNPRVPTAEEIETIYKSIF